MARVLVKALNCEKGPTDDPCNICRFCQEVNNNNSLDYLEIDGASNRGIDQIREINDKLHYSSPDGKYRVFVIDEVHMLTIEAFNALLKSLEEPPEKIVFIFCTTEAHKVPRTISSRCQQYNFYAFSMKEISDQLKKILDSEKYSYDDESVFFIARAAGGSMRDSQSILDQAIAFCGGGLTIEKVRKVLGISSSAMHFEFLQNLSTGKLADNKTMLSTLLFEGQNIRQFMFEILACINSIIFIRQQIADLELLQVTAADYDTLKSFLPLFTDSQLFLLSDIIFDFLDDLKSSGDEKAVINYYLIRIHRYKGLISSEQLKADILKTVELFGKDTGSETAVLEPETVKNTPEQTVGFSLLDFNVLMDKFRTHLPEFNNIVDFLSFKSCNEKIFALGYCGSVELASEHCKLFERKLGAALKKQNTEVKKIIISAEKVQEAVQPATVQHGINDDQHITDAAELFDGTIQEEN